MSSKPRPVLIAVVAVASAIAIWAVVAETIRRSTSLEPMEIESLLVIIVTGILLDAVVAVRTYRGRAGWPDLAWLGVRVLLSAAGLLLVTLPSYVIAAIALTRRRAPDAAAQATADPARPHAFRSASSGWFGSSLAPFGLTRNLAGARQFAASACAVCGASEEAPIHAPAADVAEPEHGDAADRGHA